MDDIREPKPVQERLDVYDPQHRRTGRVIFRGDPVEGEERLLVTHVCVMNGKNEMLCQRRSPAKGHYGGRWEEPGPAAQREQEEELGLALPAESIRFLFTEPFSYVLDDYHIAHAEVDPATLTLEEAEVAEAAWFSFEDVKAMIADGRFVDYPLAGIERVFRAAAE